MTKIRQKFYLDHWLLIAVIVLVSFGLVMVASSSMVISDRDYGYPLHFIARQVMYLGLGVGIAIIVACLPTKIWEQLSLYLLFLSFILLVLVLVPHIGREVNGSRRWIALGPFTVQVSEVVKFCVIVYLASFLTRREEEVRTRITGFLKPMLLLVIISGFLLLEPDFGATVVIMITALAMMFFAGVRLWQFIVLLIVVALIMAAIAVAAPYRLERLVTFLHPWAHQYGSGYQLTQSLIAFGRGGWFGVGLGNSIQKLFYLPEAHTDFLFAVLAEELGLIGTLSIIGLFSLLITRILKISYIAYLQERLFEAYLAFGFGLWLGLQAMVNIGVNAGVLPTKGLTLPFMSYGGSSMLINSVVIAILLRIAHDCREPEGTCTFPAQTHKKGRARVS